jgi:hypothetical protein
MAVVSAQEAPVSPDVAGSAVAAVTALGQQVLVGNYAVAAEKMYPQWKERMALRVGGQAALEKQLAGVGQQMQKNGITLKSFKPIGKPSIYEVGPGTKREVVNGQVVETLTYSKWLVLVPTQVEYRVLKPADKNSPAKPYTLISKGFQVAVSDKGKNNWTFIDGNELSINDLRSIFITLPDTMVLPEVKRELIPN